MPHTRNNFAQPAGTAEVIYHTSMDAQFRNSSLFISLTPFLKKSYAFGKKNWDILMFWMEEYFDRYIRNADHFRNAVNYIENNPVKAGLCSKPSDWPFSSAWFREHGKK